MPKTTNTHKKPSQRHTKKASKKPSKKHATHTKSTKRLAAPPKPKKLSKKEQEVVIARERLLEETRRSAYLLENKSFTQHISNNVGMLAPQILRELAKNSKTDEEIASQLNIKVNDIRRALNLMNGYSIVKYDVNKDNKGWLIFKWKINNEKLESYINKIESEMTKSSEPNLPGDCNDFFMCKKCYSDQKVILPFDTAFESGFNCESCGKPYTILNKEETVALFQQAAKQ